MFHRNRLGDLLRTGGLVPAAVLAAVVVFLAAGAAVAQGSSPDEAVAPDGATALAATDSEAPSSPSPADREDLLSEKPTTNGEEAPDLPSMGMALVKMVVFMLLLLALLVGAAIAFQRFARGKITLGGPKRPLRMVDRLTLGPKTGVCLVNACGRYLVLGVAEREISVLLEVPAADDDEAETDFSGTLAKAASKPDAKTPDGIRERP